MISREDIEKIIDAAKIEEVVGDFLELKRRGVNYIACCPFHNEKTPSFVVNPSRGIFKCFGCGEGGDSVAFVMKYQHYTYPEALRYLAKKYGIEIKEKELSQEELQARDEKDVMYHINELACKYYYDNLLNSDEGKEIGLTYFQERQISRQTIDTWQLGYSKQKGNDFTQYALQSGYKEEDLIKSGLVLKSEKDGSLYDRFRGRVTFPVYNVGGRVLGFSARILSSDKTKAKYVNSPESPIYIKGKTLFGLNFARTEIAKQDLCYLVEGNVDAIMMSQNEVKNVVASSGTALTSDQILMIKRYTNNVAVLYDGDAAGIHAAIRATDMFLKEGMHISIVLFPDGDDPDSFARKHTQDEFQRFLKDNAQNFIIYRTNLALQQAQGDPIKKAELVKDIIHSISLIPDLIERTTYIEQCSSILKIRETVLTDQLNKEIIHNAYLKTKEDKRTKQQTENSQPPTETPDSQTMEDRPIETLEEQQKRTAIERKTEVVERNLLRILLLYSENITNQPSVVEGKVVNQTVNAGEFILNEIVSMNITFIHPLYKKIIDQYIVEFRENQRVLSYKTILSQGDYEVNNLITTLLMDLDSKSISDKWVERYEAYIPSIHSQQIMDRDIQYTTLTARLYQLSLMQDALKQNMLQAPDNTEYIEQYATLNRIRNAIAKELSHTTL